VNVVHKTVKQQLAQCQATCTTAETEYQIWNTVNFQV